MPGKTPKTPTRPTPAKRRETIAAAMLGARDADIADLLTQARVEGWGPSACAVLSARAEYVRGLRGE